MIMPYAMRTQPEHEFAHQADNDPKVVCLLKLPEFYKIPTPIGNYRPDFGLVVKQRSLKNSDDRELYFVIETKSTHDLNDTHALTEDERTKIQCAVKHFQALGIRAEIGGDVSMRLKKDRLTIDKPMSAIKRRLKITAI